jgi:hypothetical protein
MNMMMMMIMMMMNVVVEETILIHLQTFFAGFSLSAQQQI